MAAALRGTRSAMRSHASQRCRITKPTRTRQSSSTWLIGQLRRCQVAHTQKRSKRTTAPVAWAHAARQSIQVMSAARDQEALATWHLAAWTLAARAAMP
eukprot:10148684-Karenia_brevis.AAC.1